MESDLIHTVPKLEHKKAMIALEEANSSRMRDMDMIAETKRVIEGKYQREKLISTILMIGVFVLLCACAVLVFHFFSVRGVTSNL